MRTTSPRYARLSMCDGPFAHHHPPTSVVRVPQISIDRPRRLRQIATQHQALCRECCTSPRSSGLCTTHSCTSYAMCACVHVGGTAVLPSPSRGRTLVTTTSAATSSSSACSAWWTEMTLQRSACRLNSTLAVFSSRSPPIVRLLELKPL